jgi:hypothetical protein
MYRYRTEQLAKHWSTNKQGFSLAPSCTEVFESIEHILLWCPSYQPTRENLKKLWQVWPAPFVAQLSATILNGSPATQMQFLLDPSPNSHVIFLNQIFGTEQVKTVFHLTMTWCFAIHKARAKLLGRWTSR